MEQGGFDALFGDHSAEILAFALRRVGSREEAEDVVSETFAVAWRRRDTLPKEALPWLYGVASKVISNQRRSERRWVRLRGKLASEPPPIAPDPTASLADRDEFAVAFAQLSEGQREVLRLVAWEGLGGRDAAIALGCTESAFKVRLHRARRDLAKRIELGGHVQGEMAVSTEQQIKAEPR